MTPCLGIIRVRFEGSYLSAAGGDNEGNRISAAGTPA